MSDNADFLCVYFFSTTQIVDGSFRICCEILVGGSCVVTLRCGCSSVVTSQHCDSVSGQIVGDDKERFMSHNLLIPVLRAASCHHNHCRKFTSLFGKSQRACKIDSGLFIPYRDFFVSIRKRRLRLLRTFWGSGFSLFQIQRHGHSLRESSAYRMVTAQFTFVGSMDRRYLNRHYGVLERSGLRLYTVGSLVGAVECCHISSLFCLINVEYDSQRTGGDG